MSRFVRIYTVLIIEIIHFILMFYCYSESNQIVITTADGMVYFYTLNQSDGYCQFLSQHTLLDSSESMNRSISSEVFQKDM